LPVAKVNSDDNAKQRRQCRDHPRLKSHASHENKHIGTGGISAGYNGRLQFALLDIGRREKFAARARGPHPCSEIDMLMKIVLVVLLLLVLVSLFSGLYFMYRDKGRSRRTVVALTIRVGLSITIFVIVIAAYFMGLLPGK
jgi:hypothetical protein